MRDLLEEGQELNSMMRFLDTTRKFKLEGFQECHKFIQ